MEATELLNSNIDFVYAFFQAAELEARQTERYVLVTIGAIYTYLTTKEIPARFRQLAWYAPVLIVAFAAIRALGLMLRQMQLLDYLTEIETKFPLPNQAPGWAYWYGKQASVVAWPTAMFYLLLIVVTVVLAYRMRKSLE